MTRSYLTHGVEPAALVAQDVDEDPESNKAKLEAEKEEKAGLHKEDNAVRIGKIKAHIQSGLLLDDLVIASVFFQLIDHYILSQLKCTGRFWANKQGEVHPAGFSKLPDVGGIRSR